MDNNNSIGTCATGATNATRDILQEVQDTGFNLIIETDQSTVVSAMTTFTTVASPQHSNETSIPPGNNYFRSRSPPPLSSDQMDQDSEENEDEIEVGSNATMNDAQDEEIDGRSQESNSYDTMMSNNLLRGGSSLEAECTVDNQGTETKQHNAESHATKGS